MNTKNQNIWENNVKRNDLQDAKRYQFLRKLSYRFHIGKKYYIRVNFETEQNDKWPDQNTLPDQHTFLDLDMAIDEKLLNEESKKFEY